MISKIPDGSPDQIGMDTQLFKGVFLYSRAKFILDITIDLLYKLIISLFTGNKTGKAGEAMKKILFICASNYTFPPESKVVLAGKNHKPLGILSIATYLSEKGFSVKCIDQMIEDPLPYIRENYNDLLFIGISAMSANYQSAKDILYFIKKLNPDLPCIIGGAHPSGTPEDVINDGFDVAVIGEGESICENLANIFKITNNKNDLLASLLKIQGIAYRDINNKIAINPRIQFIENLDDLPIIDRSFLSSVKYSNTHITVHTSRGCPGKCIFCQSGPTLFGHKIRQRSPQNVIMEIKDLLNSGAVFITFLDDCLLWDESWVHEFCHIIKEEQLKFLWVCETRAQYVSESIIKEIIEAGCRGLNIGFESGSDNVLKFLRKNTNTKIYKNCIDILHRFGLSFHSYIIIGSPHETREDLQLTVDFIKDAKPTQICISHLTPIYGSELFGYLSDKGLIKDVNQQVFYQNKYPIKYEHLSEEEIDQYEVEIYKAMYIPGQIPEQLKGNAIIFDDPIPHYVVGSQKYTGILRIKNRSNFHWIAYTDQQIKIPFSEISKKISRDNFYQQLEGKCVMLKVDFFDNNHNLIHSDIGGTLVGNVPINAYGTFVFEYNIPSGYNEIYFEYNLYLPLEGILMSNLEFRPYRRKIKVAEIGSVNKTAIWKSHHINRFIRVYQAVESKFSVLKRQIRRNPKTKDIQIPVNDPLS
jgi:anaerobic magnesium-protoporphyrin IX monomethyl ester cyclase